MNTLYNNNLGLTSKDRNDLEQLDVALQGNDYNYDTAYNELYKDSIPNLTDTIVNSNDTINNTGVDYIMSTPSTNLEENNLTSSIDADDNLMQEESNSTLSLYREYSKNQKSIDFYKHKITNIADEKSPWYRRYKDTDMISFTDDDWVNLAANYDYLKESYGEEYADKWLNAAIEQNAAENLNFFVKLGNGFMNMGASVAGSLISTAGSIGAVFAYIDADVRERANVEGLNEVLQFLNHVIDNKMTQYGHDVVKYGTMYKSKQELHKIDGTTTYPILYTEALREKVFSVNTIPEAIGSHGFTAAMAITSFGLSSLGRIALKRGRKIAVKKLGDLAENATKRATMEAVEAATNLAKEGKVWNYLQAPILGTLEGLYNGLETKNITKEEGLELAKEYLRVNKDIMYKNIWESLSREHPEYNNMTIKVLADLEFENQVKKIYDKVEESAAKAGINDVLINSTINGVTIAAFQSVFLAPPVRKTIQESKLFDTFRKYKVLDVNGKNTATGRMPSLAYNTTKPVVGELLQEGMQNVSSDVTLAMAEYSLKSFIDDLFNGKSMYEVGDYIEGTLSAGWKALDNSLFSKETLKSAVLGAISSGLGGPMFVNPRVFKTEFNPKTGKYETKFNLRKNENENWFEYFYRISSWQSGAIEGYKEGKNKQLKTKETLAALLSWLDDENNEDTLMHLIRSISLGTKSLDAINTADEFEYRNTLMAKLVSDALMLAKLKGTEFYRLYFKKAKEISSMESDSAEARSLVLSLKEDANAKAAFLNMEDSEIFDTLQKNANKILDIYNETVKEAENLQSSVGYLDKDIQHAMIYSKLMLGNWNKRLDSLSNEIKTASGTSSNSESLRGLKNPNSILNYLRANTAIKEIDHVIKDLTTKISNIEKRKNLNDTNDLKKLKELKEKLLLKNKEKSKYEKVLLDTEIKSFIENNFTKESIMSLPSMVRAYILDDDFLKYLSLELKDVVESLKTEAINKDPNFMLKIKDYAKIESGINNYLKEYASLIENPLGFNEYALQQQLNAIKYLTKKRIEELKKASDFETFKEVLDDIRSSRSAVSEKLIEEELKDSEWYLKYKNINSKYNSFSDFIGKLCPYFNTLDTNTLGIIQLAILYAYKNDVDFLNTDALYQAMSSNNSFETYVENFNKANNKKSIEAFIYIEEEFMPVFNKIIDQYKEFLKDTERANNIPVNDEIFVTSLELSPQSTIEHNIDSSKSDNTATLESLDSKPLIDNNDALSNAKNSILLLLNNNSIINNLEFLLDLKEADSHEALFEIINKYADSYSSLVKTMLLLTVTQNSRRNNSNINMDSSRVETLNLESLLNDNNPLLALLQEYIRNHKMIEYLKENSISVKTPIYFIVPSDLYKKSENLTLENIPLVACIKLEDGSLLPIAILPRTGNPQKSGSNQYGIIRNLVRAKLEKDSFEFDSIITDDNGNAITSNLYKMNETSLGVYSTQQHSIIEILENDLSEADKLRVEENPSLLLKKIKDFINNLKRVKDNTHFNLYYFNIPLLVLSISKTINSKNKTFKQFVSEGNDSFEYNSRTKRVKRAFEEAIKSIQLYDWRDYNDNESLQNELQNINTAFSKNFSRGLSLIPGFSLKIEYLEDGFKVVLYDKLNNAVTSQDLLVEENLNPSLLSSLILSTILNQNNGEQELSVREYNGSEIFKWQVDYSDFKEDAEMQSNDIESIIKDNILVCNYKSFKSSYKSAILNVPNVSKNEDVSSLEILENTILEENAEIEQSQSEQNIVEQIVDNSQELTSLENTSNVQPIDLNMPKEEIVEQENIDDFDDLDDLSIFDDENNSSASTNSVKNTPKSEREIEEERNCKRG